MQSEAEVILTIFGAALCLGGWVIFWMGSRLVGMALGMGFGFVFGDLLAILLKLPAGSAALVLFGCTLMGAFGGLFAMRAVTNFVFALNGFLFGALLGRMGADVYFQIKHAPFDFTGPVIAAILAGAIAMALLAIYLQKHIVIVTTSYIGAAFLTASIRFFLHHKPWSFLCIFLAAIIWQVILVTRLLDSGKNAKIE